MLVVSAPKTMMMMIATTASPRIPLENASLSPGS